MVTGQDREPRRPTPWCSAPAATATSSTSRPTPRAPTPPPSGAPTSAGAAFANPCYTQIHPTCIPVSGDYQSKLTLMSESLRNDGRVWVPKRAGDRRAAGRDSRERARLLPRAPLPELRQPGAARHRVAGGQGGVRRGPRGRAGRAGRLPRLRRRHQRGSASDTIRERYGNLFEMYQRITDENPYRGADADLPGGALHDGRALGGLQPDEHHSRAARDRRGQLLRPRRQPAGRERAHAGAGRRLLHPARARSATTWPRARPAPVDTVARRVPAGRGGGRRADPRSFLAIKGKRTVDSFHRELGQLLWDKCGMARNAAGLQRGAGADPGAARGVLAQRERARAATPSSTRRWRRPAGWPTSSSSPS